jgi:DNA-binding MarR family transcriptional regulator
LGCVLLHGRAPLPSDVALVDIGVFERLAGDVERDGEAVAENSRRERKLTGPLTIGEMGKHFNRAQSVVSEMVEHLERDGLVERMRDPKDKRRSLVWLSDKGLALLDREREVLSSDLVARAMAVMNPGDRRALLRGMQALIAANREEEPKERKRKP